MPGGSRRVLVFCPGAKRRERNCTAHQCHTHTHMQPRERGCGRPATTCRSMPCIMHHQPACTWHEQLQPAATNPDSSGPCQLMQAHQEGQTAHTGFAPRIFQHFTRLVKRSAKQSPNQSTNRSLAAIFQDGLCRCRDQLQLLQGASQCHPMRCAAASQRPVLKCALRRMGKLLLLLLRLRLLLVPLLCAACCVLGAVCAEARPAARQLQAAPQSFCLSPSLVTL